MKSTRQGKISYLQPDWAAGSPVAAGFTIRNGGVSRAPFNSLNLGTNTEDTAAHVEANRAAMARAFDLQPHLLLTVKQVHGTGVLAVTEPNFDLSHFQRVESDAIITNQSGIMIGVLVADCYPVILYDGEGFTAGVVHAGWKGAAAGLIGQTVQAMCELLGSRPEHLRAAIGPGIGFHKYEVDRPVRDAFREGSGHWSRIAKETRLGHWQLDLRLSCLLQLEEAGIARDMIDIVDECTCCHKEKFFSHRRDQGQTGRQMGFILLP